MKKIFFLIAMFFVLTVPAQVKIGSNPTIINSSSLLEMESTTKGLLPPRMTSAQMNAIATPATGLHVFCSNCSPVGLHFFNGSTWSAVGDTSSGGSSSSGGVSASMAFTTGTYIWGGPTVTRNIVITIVNNSFSTVAWTNAAANLELTGNTGLSVVSASPASTSIASGATGTITFQVTGVIGTMDDITATWTKLALTVVGTKEITPGSATFTNAINNAYVFSANASGVNVAGTLPIGTTVSVPYTSGVGNYAAYTSPDMPIPSTHCNDGASDWTFAYSYPAGTFATSGNLTATLITKKGGVVAAWPAFQVTNISTINSDALWSFINVNGVNMAPASIGVDYGGDAIRGQLTTSAAAYDAAADNNWVPISTAEYNLLLTNVPGANKYMMQNTAATSVGTITANQTMVPANYYVSGYLVPNNSYVFAIAVKMGGITAANPFAGSTIRFNSPVVNGTFTVLGNSSIVTHNSAAVAGANYHWVLKRPSQKTTTNSFISFYSPNHSIMNVGDLTNSTYRIATGSLNIMSTSTISQGSPMIQVLATTTKSW